MRQGLEEGAYIGPYQLEALIGRGGMGEIWRARLPSDGSLVAIKVLRRDLKNAPQLRERFRREAELTQRLRSPQTLKVINYGVTQDQSSYIIMEFLDGEDLQSRLDREGSLPIHESLQISIELLKALSEAHQAGVVHRDIKPANIFLLKSKGAHGDTKIKILDFGLATLSYEQAETGLRGSYLYMAPEQIKRQPVSPATDLYGVGALLFKMISGSPPYTPTGADKMFAQLEMPIPTLSARVPHLSISSSLDQLLTRCLAKQAEERPENADVLRRGLEFILAEVSRPKEGLVDGLLAAEDEDHQRLSRRNMSSSRIHSIQPMSSTPAPRHASMSFTPQPEVSFAPAEQWGGGWTLAEWLEEQRDRLVTHWAQSISERPEYSRLQPHQLRSSVRQYLDLFIQVASGKPLSVFKSLIDHLFQQTFTRPTADYAPLLNLSLLRTNVEDFFPYEWETPQREHVQEELYQLFYDFRGLFIKTIVARRTHNAAQFLHRFFLQDSEYTMMCTPNGVTLNTHSRLRSALGDSESSSLSGNNLFETLRGYQPALKLQRAFEDLHHRPFQTTFILENPQPHGSALKIKLSPYLIGNTDQPQVLILFDILQERQVTEFIPAFSPLEADFSSPQALPWQMTSEVPSLTPDDIKAYAQSHLMDRPQSAYSSALDLNQAPPRQRALYGQSAPSTSAQREGALHTGTYGHNSSSIENAHRSREPSILPLAPDAREYSTPPQQSMQHSIQSQVGYLSTPPLRRRVASITPSPSRPSAAPASQWSHDGYGPTGGTLNASLTPNSIRPYLERSASPPSLPPEHNINQSGYHQPASEPNERASSGMTHEGRRSIRPQSHFVTGHEQSMFPLRSSEHTHSIHEKVTRESSVRDDSVRDNSVRDNSVRDDSVRDDSVRDDSVRDDSVVESPMHNHSLQAQQLSSSRIEPQRSPVRRGHQEPALPPMTSEAVSHSPYHDENRQTPAYTSRLTSARPLEPKDPSFQRAQTPVHTGNPRSRRTAPPQFDAPVKSTRHSRIKALENPQEDAPRSLLVHTLVFIICVLLLWTFRQPIKEILRGSASTIQNEQSTVVVNPGSVFLKIQDLKEANFIRVRDQKVLCQKLNYCEVPSDHQIRIESTGYYPRYLNPEEMMEREGKTWSLSLDSR